MRSARKQSTFIYYLSRTKNFMFAGDYDQVIASATQAINISGAIAASLREVYEFRARAYIAKKHFKDARSDYETLIQFYPRDATLFNQIGLCDYQLHYFQDALANFKVAIAFDSNLAVAHYNCANTHLRLKQWVQAVSSSLQAESLNPYRPEFMEQLKTCLEYLEEEKDIQEVIQLIQDSLILDEKKEKLLNHLKRNPSVAEEAIFPETVEAALEAETDQTLLAKGMQRFQGQKMDEALLFFQQAIELNAECFSAHYHRAKIYVIKQDFKNALHCYNKAHQINPQSDVYFERAHVLMQENRLVEAIFDYFAIIELQKDVRSDERVLASLKVCFQQLANDADIWKVIQKMKGLNIPHPQINELANLFIQHSAYVQLKMQQKSIPHPVEAPVPVFSPDVQENHSMEIETAQEQADAVSMQTEAIAPEQMNAIFMLVETNPPPTISMLISDLHQRAMKHAEEKKFVEAISDYLKIIELNRALPIEEKVMSSLQICFMSLRYKHNVDSVLHNIMSAPLSIEKRDQVLELFSSTCNLQIVPKKITHESMSIFNVHLYGHRRPAPGRPEPVPEKLKTVSIMFQNRL